MAHTHTDTPVRVRVCGATRRIHNRILLIRHVAWQQLINYDYPRMPTGTIVYCSGLLQLADKKKTIVCQNLCMNGMQINRHSGNSYS